MKAQPYTITFTTSPVAQCAPNSFVIYNVTVCNIGSFSSPTLQLQNVLGNLTYAPSFQSTQFSTTVFGSNTSQSNPFQLSAGGCATFSFSVKNNVLSNCNSGGLMTDMTSLLNAETHLPIQQANAPAVNVIVNTPTSTPLPTNISVAPPTGSVVSFNNQVHITQNMSWDNVEVYGSNGGEIVIDPGVKLGIKNCRFYGCQTMWKSITVSTNAFFSTENSYISQGEMAIRCLNGGKVNVTTTTFENNCIGVGNGNLAATTPVQTGQIDIRLSDFNSMGAFAAPYPAQVFKPNPNGFGYAGIWLRDIPSANVICVSNFFKHSCIGVRIDRGTAYIDGNTFLEIGASSYYANAINVTTFNLGGASAFGLGAAIFGNGLVTNSSTQSAGVFSLSVGTASNNYFYTCTAGISLNGMGGTFVNNNMDNVTYGFHVRNLSGQTATIGANVTPNFINTSFLGIWLYNNVGALNLNVGHNEFHRYPSPVSTGSAIKAEEISLANPHLAIHHNSVEGRFPNPIAIRNIMGANVYSNDLNLNSADVFGNIEQQVGIAMGNCSFTGILCNHIYTPNTYYGPNFQIGIQNGISNNIRILYNDISTTQRGMRFDGACTNNVISMNTLSGNPIGIWCSANTNFGFQGANGVDYGNVFNPPFTWAAYHDGGNYGSNPNPTLSMISTTMPISTAFPNLASNHFFNTATSFLTLSSTFCQSLPLKPVNSSREINATDSAIANNSLVFPLYEDETIWSLRKELYIKLQADSSAWANDSVMINFMVDMQNGTLAEFADTDNRNRRKSDFSEQSQELLTNLYAQMDSIKQLILEYDSLLQTNLSEQEIEYYGTLAGNAHLYLDSLTSNANIIIQIEQTNVNERVNLIYTQNGLLNPTEIYEQNEKMVTEIELSLRLNDIADLNETQISQLQGIINQCPLAGGPAVYRARTIYMLYDQTDNYNDDAVCTQVGISWRQINHSQIKVSGLNFYPNPARDAITVEYAKEYAGEKASIINALSIKVSDFELPMNMNSYTHHLPALATGVYTLRVGKNNFKLVVQ